MLPSKDSSWTGPWEVLPTIRESPAPELMVKVRCLRRPQGLFPAACCCFSFFQIRFPVASGFGGGVRGLTRSEAVCRIPAGPPAAPLFREVQGRAVGGHLDRTPSFPVRSVSSVSAPAPHQQLSGICSLVIAFTQTRRAEDTRLPTRSWTPACTWPQGRSGGDTASLWPLALRPVQCSLPRARVPQLTCRRCLEKLRVVCGPQTDEAQCVRRPPLAPGEHPVLPQHPTDGRFGFRSLCPSAVAQW